MPTSWPMIAAVLMIVLVAGCAEEPDTPGIVTPPTVAAQDKGSVVQANNAFAFNLYTRLRGQKGNLFFSPESLSVALSMAWCGARGETAGQMASVLGYRTDRPIAPDWIAKAYGEHLAQLFAAPKGYELTAANAIWGQKGYPFAPEYLVILKSGYGAGLEGADFAGDREGARKAINDWVKLRTRDKIDQVVGPDTLQPQTRLVLVNAVYFKAAWRDPFDKENTKPGSFYPTAGRATSVPMMHQEGHWHNYAEGEQLQTLELSYLDDGISMVIILPKKRDGLRSIESTITAEKVAACLALRRYREINVTVPKFGVTSTFFLRKTLGDMGMPLAFDQTKADFGGMSRDKEGLFLQDVIHKAYVNVDEQGTEATAASGAAAAAKDGEEPVEFIADHPFLFLIRDKASGCILFMGRVVNPKGE